LIATRQPLEKHISELFGLGQSYRLTGKLTARKTQPDTEAAGAHETIRPVVRSMTRMSHTGLLHPKNVGELPGGYIACRLTGSTRIDRSYRHCR
jgi:hypothetical protein